jgi:hypothetical protein
MKTLVALDETNVRFLLLLCETAKGAGTAEQEALRAETDHQLRIALEVLLRAQADARRRARKEPSE